MKNPSFFFWPKLALRELLNNRRFSLFFLFNLALGLAGFIALESFKESLDTHLGRNSQAILGADIALTSYVPFEEKTLNILESQLPENSLYTRKISLFTMVATKDQSRLVQVTGIEQDYPFYGRMILKNVGSVDPVKLKQSLDLSGEAWFIRNCCTCWNLMQVSISKLESKVSALQTQLQLTQAVHFHHSDLLPVFISATPTWRKLVF